ncbi:hypothetical protein SELMODRAFT_438766 [Selaginella moellendorffii]|uniref:HD domain-containing protein n=1 Tax=Selaginella moellendorffii TaxID=88036 RepID=D8QZ81_SELML|nr:uncharacterized protein LOC9654424 [Selaginella moellendorffii]EFJ34748.1 hypothetical protein SELMODRAFT_438766 [Selaginella moellendorffii]|eukprot:XP_002964415.1 uncharacterized protein LOC9654424 [Selaginella moellendorffii]
MAEFSAIWKRVSGQDEQQARSVREILEGFYSDPCRKYHGLNHVKDCLDQLADFRHGGNADLADSQLDEVAVALWFHDAIYNPKSTNNEANSAALFVDLSRGMEASARERIERMILATRDHIGDDPAERLIVDIDLSILGRGKEDFNAYNEGIRSEYSWVPENVYREKRAAVLKRFLERERLFWTDYFHAKFEREARANLKTTLAALEEPESGRDGVAFS